MRLKNRFALLVGAGTILLLNPSALQAKIKWVSSYRDAKKIAKASGDLMMLDFYTEW